MDFSKKGNIGKVLFLDGGPQRRRSATPQTQPGISTASTRSGDNIVEQACHIIDLMVWAAGSHPLRAYGTGGVSLFKNEPPGRTTMDNYTVIFEFPDDIRCTFTQLYFDPPGFTGTKERVFGSLGAVDLATAQFIELGQKRPAEDRHGENTKIPRRSRLRRSMTTRVGRRSRSTMRESARISTLTAMLGRKSIYERRVVSWEEVDV